MRIRLSYIVPVYNGEKYLRRCLDSLWRQELAEDDFEVICVDDHSHDSSVEILKQYANNYANVKLILHEQNKKTGTSLNEALREAKGVYVQFLGQDDWIEEGCGRKLVEICDTNRLDTLCFNYNRVNHDGSTVLSKVEVFKNSNVMDGESFIHTCFADTFCIYLLGYEWRALFRKDYLQRSNIAFPNDVIYEDTTFLFKAIWCADRVLSLSDYLYNYRMNERSVTDVSRRYRGYQTYEFAFVAGREVLDLSRTIGVEKESGMLYELALRYFSGFSYKVVPMAKAEKKVFYRFVQDNYEKVKECVALIPWYYRCLVHPKLGPLLALGLYPLFWVKHLFVKRNYASY